MTNRKRWIPLVAAIGLLALTSVLGASAALGMEDCNSNGIDDSCDLDCGPAAGVCDVQGCGTAADCDGNLIPDSCDVAAYPSGCSFPVTLAGNPTGEVDATYLGPPDGTFYGIAGSEVIYDMGCGVVVDGPGADFTVYEVGTGQAEFSRIDVLVSVDGIDFVSVKNGELSKVPIPGDENHTSAGFARSYDLRPSGTTLARFVKIQDTGSGVPDPDNGFDLDAVGSINRLGSDCDSDGNVDRCQLVDDCNGNLVPESCELSLGLVDDCDISGTPDTCDTQGGIDDCDGDSIPDSCEPDCDNNLTPDDCDLIAMPSDDCNANLVPDVCDLAATIVDFDSGDQFAFGGGHVRSTTILGAPPAAGDVTVDITVLGDLDASNEYVDIDLNGTALGRLFATGGQNCVITTQQIVISAGVYNTSVAGGNAVFSATAPSAVAAGGCLDGFVRFEIGYDPIVDCDANVMVDSCDIAGGSADLNLNGIVDTCEPDCNGNGNPDDYDVVQGLSLDCNANLQPDECDVSSGASLDCNTDGVPDECEIDCNTNGIPDDCDLTAGTSQDCDANARPDECDLADAPGCAFPDTVFDNSIGGDDSFYIGPPDDIYQGLGGQIVTLEFTCGVVVDGPGSDFNVYELDGSSQEFNSLADVQVSQDGLTFFSVKSTEGPAREIPGDEQHGSRNFARSYELAGSGLTWARYVRLDGNGTGAGGGGTGFDLDAVGAFHVIDDDCDGSGVLDDCEPLADCDGNELVDLCEAATVEGTDCNLNATPDLCDVAAMTSDDCDGNLVPDECQSDCNANDVADVCDVTAMTAEDCNGNTVLDECEFPQATQTSDLGTTRLLTGGVPQVFVLTAPFIASGPVSVDVTVNGDYGASNEWIDIDLNGTVVGRLFDIGGTGCTDTAQSLLIPADQFNLLVAGGDAIFTLIAPNAVNWLDCSDPSTQIGVAYDAAQDCNTNGEIDSCDVDGGGSIDINLNGLPDECEPDCNGNGIPDSYDIDQHTSGDCNRNGIPDECDLSAGTSLDCNVDQMPDECPICPPVEVSFIMDTSSSMSDEAAVLCAGLTQLVADLQADGIDVDAELLAIDAPGSGNFACLTDSVLNRYGDTVPGSPPPGNEILGDCPGNPQVASEDWGRATSMVSGGRAWGTDTARLVIPVADEGPWCGDPVSDPGVDRDSINHAIQVAIGNDVIVSPITGSGSSGAVVGIAIDLASATGGDVFSSTDPAEDLLAGIEAVIFQACDAINDCNGNDVPDTCDIGAGTSQDCNLSSIPDECENDCNGNGVEDSCDIADATSLDDNLNAIPDECEVLQLLLDPFDLLWSAVPSALGYDVIDGDLGLLEATDGNFALSTSGCMVNDHPTETLPHGVDPSPGEGIWYLVRAVLGTGPLSYDALGNSLIEPRDTEIVASGNACP